MPQIDNRISLGNLITLIVLMISGIVAFSAVQGKTTANSEDIKDHETRIRVLENVITGSLARIDGRLERLEKELSK
jgi:hypothetical protein